MYDIGQKCLFGTKVSLECCSVLGITMLYLMCIFMYLANLWTDLPF